MRFNLTLAGLGSKSSGGSAGGIVKAASKIIGSDTLSKKKDAGPSGLGAFGDRRNKAKPPPSPPSGIERTGAENVRNVGGGRGVEIANAVRGLKGLTGQ